ncbi:MAG: TetR/AcrR family transcriptional regulator [Deltaproteobacteria bacterium]|nr:TetR/AcrR family transcriptional regulator [Deltaproteobacteria bacterium]
MARPKQTGNETETRDRLLVAAEAEFGRVGFDRARLEDIAKVAGISRPSLLYHFETKEKLYERVVRNVFNKIGELFMESIKDAGDFRERLDRVIVRYIAFVDEHPAVALIVLRELLDASPFSRRIITNEVLPLLDEVARFIERDGKGYVPNGMPIRPVIAQIAMSIIVRSASGELKDALYGDADATRTIVSAMLQSKVLQKKA